MRHLMECFVDVFLDKIDVERMFVNYVTMLAEQLFSKFNLLWALFTILSLKNRCIYIKGMH